MKKLSTSLMFVLMLALPLQGIASVSQAFCHTTSAVTLHDHEHEHGHEAHADQQDSHHPSVDHKCSHCAQCCSVTALPADHRLASDSMLLDHGWTAVWRVLHSDVEPHYLERPPRPLQA